MVLVVEAVDRCFLDGPVHPFDLAVCPRVLGLGKPMIDIVLGAGKLEGMGAEEVSVRHGLFDLRNGRASRARCCEVNAVVSEDGVDLVRHRRDEVAEEVGGYRIPASPLGGGLLIDAVALDGQPQSSWRCRDEVVP